MIRGGRTYRFVTDVRGSVRLVVDAATGAVAQRLDYGLWDADTGLVRFGARDYAPELNRWTSKDPLGFAAGDTSLYVYGLGDPITFVDPSGAVVPLIAAAIVAYKGVDFLWNAYDAYQTAQLVMDPCVSVDEKLTEVALIAVGFAAGAVIGKSLRAMRRAKALSRIGCFAAGTLVVTATAAAVAMPIPIEEVKPGAAVAAYDAAQDAIVTARVVAVHERPGVATLALGLESEASGSTVLVTTAEHPLWSWSAGGYSRADRIERGDWLFTRDAGWARVASVAYTGREETVYNLTVEGAESYFVGEAGVLAHNTPVCWKSQKQFGHTFKEHGAGAKRTQSLTDQARDTGVAQGQWLDNERAAEFLHEQAIDGPASVRIPDGLGQAILPDGTIVPSTWATLVPSPTGLRTAYPLPR